MFRVFFVFVFILSAGCLVAQPLEDPIEDTIIEQIKLNNLAGQFGIFYSQSLTQGSLRDAYDSLGAPTAGYGFALHGGYYFDPVPLMIGGEFAMHFFGTRDRAYTPSGGTGTTRRFDQSSQNMSIPILAFVRIQPNLGTWVFPYVELDIGTTIQTSMLSVSHSGLAMGHDTDSHTEASANLTYGIGFGLAIKIADFVSLPNTLERFLLDMRIRYLWGTPVDTPQVVPNEDFSYTIHRVRVSEPSQINFQLGILIQL